MTAPGAAPALRALLRPRALVSHALVLAVVAVLVALGQWQVARLGEVRAQNALLAERLAAPSADLTDLLAAGVAVADLEFRRVTATGTFRPDEEVLQRNRVNAGLTGLDVLTPLDLGDGRTLLVRRGWVPPDLDEPRSRPRRRRRVGSGSPACSRRRSTSRRSAPATPTTGGSRGCSTRTRPGSTGR